jgi:hypothetical protein
VRRASCPELRPQVNNRPQALRIGFGVLVTDVSVRNASCWAARVAATADGFTFSEHLGGGRASGPAGSTSQGAGKHGKDHPSRARPNSPRENQPFAFKATLRCVQPRLFLSHLAPGVMSGCECRTHRRSHSRSQDLSRPWDIPRHPPKAGPCGRAERFQSEADR